MHNPARAWYDLGRHEEAIKMMEDCIPLRVDTLGQEHRHTISLVKTLEDWREKQNYLSSQGRKTRRSRESASVSVDVREASSHPRQKSMLQTVKGLLHFD